MSPQWLTQSNPWSKTSWLVCPLSWRLKALNELDKRSRVRSVFAAQGAPPNSLLRWAARERRPPSSSARCLAAGTRQLLCLGWSARSTRTSRRPRSRSIGKRDERRRRKRQSSFVHPQSALDAGLRLSVLKSGRQVRETIQKLLDLKLTTMAQAFRDLLAEPPGNQRSFTEGSGPWSIASGPTETTANSGACCTPRASQSERRLSRTCGASRSVVSTNR